MYGLLRVLAKFQTPGWFEGSQVEFRKFWIVNTGLQSVFNMLCVFYASRLTF